MNDSFDREVNYLRISITDRCNLRLVDTACQRKEYLCCRHEDILRYEEILEVVEIAVHLGIVKVRVTGGEPLVRRVRWIS